MLHEILLALTGYRSALFDSLGDFDAHLSPSEYELLTRLRQLAVLHSQTRQHAQRIADIHPSIICRATASSVNSVQLAKFRTKIVEVEAKILTRDTDIVGAYNIVPLALLVSEFKQYTKLLKWLWSLVRRIAPEDFQSHDANLMSGSELMDNLRQEAVTGYPELETASKELSVVAEAAWVKQLSSWVLYGQIPTFGSSDFAIQIASEPANGGFELVSQLLPRFVTDDTAQAILFVGKVRNLLGASAKSDPKLLVDHVKSLSRFCISNSPSDLTAGVAEIRLSLSSNILHNVLPLAQIRNILTLLYDFLLLGNSDFAPTLVAHADLMRKSLPKESIANDILNRTWNSLARNIDDDTISTAKLSIRLTMQKPANLHHQNSASLDFSDFLLAFPTFLVLDCHPPFDLFMQDASAYIQMHAFLLAMRRARLHLSSLWTHDGLRRHGPPLRAMWATAKAALGLLCHLSAYFEGDVVGELWQQFMAFTSDSANLNFELLQDRHRQLLDLLTSHLLLPDTAFIKCAREFLQHCDLFNNTWRADAARAQYDGVGLDRCRKMLDFSMKKVVSRLRQIDTSRVDVPDGVLKCGGVDRLLLKLNFDSGEAADETQDLISLG
ncbi:hypothetical protein EJ05DRAFT_503893 [Pseudovirgaria hyperparasitica]|uniref:Spindle pole body component n=1 Tax=Pseudovirgaria hyperparasitica TaxID=470096 RepID=A0A6A6VXC8_9PEZI|nr:uncharacterized protein EJ05DRAFT_503893 [Pseudovirgaria hyperparasitica]KAF2754354.1 hypothetical protein EJ05DRAFT_503893 [Pseudovirgaria hyperparasitica]